VNGAAGRGKIGKKQGQGELRFFKNLTFGQATGYSVERANKKKKRPAVREPPFQKAEVPKALPNQHGRRNRVQRRRRIEVINLRTERVRNRRRRIDHKRLTKNWPESQSLEVQERRRDHSAACSPLKRKRAPCFSLKEVLSKRRGGVLIEIAEDKHPLAKGPIPEELVRGSSRFAKRDDERVLRAFVIPRKIAQKGEVDKSSLLVGKREKEVGEKTSQA